MQLKVLIVLSRCLVFYAYYLRFRTCDSSFSFTVASLHTRHLDIPQFHCLTVFRVIPMTYRESVFPQCF